MIQSVLIESATNNHDTTFIKANAKRNKYNIFILLMLYTLQGVPLGFSLAIPMIIQNMHLKSFKEQAKFSFAVWPFSLKLLWAPLVDSVFIRKLGRRKSWLVPLQYFLGILFFITGFHINEWLVNTNKPQINTLTFIFFIINFLVASQDIVVDGWSLSLLERENISYSAICGSAGQALGTFLGYIMSLILTSESFWNKWWRTSPLPGGVITLQGYFYFWGTMYIIITTLLALFKSEKDNLSESSAVNDLSIIETYKLLSSIIQLPNIKKLVIILITVKVSFSSVDAAFRLKLIDGGVTSEEIATVEMLLLPLSITFPFLISKCVSIEKPLKLFFNTVPYRLLIGVAFTTLIYFTPYFLVQSRILLISYKVILIMMYFLLQLMIHTMKLMAMSFYATISDPKVGGTNMTLLTTISNLGMTSSNTGALWLIDFLTYKQCSNNHINLCSSKNDQNVCILLGGICRVTLDGFYIEVLISTIYGGIWYCVFKKPIDNLQSKNVKNWHVRMKKKERL